MRKFTQVKKICKTCKKEFWVIKSRKNTAKFCSSKCWRPTKSQLKKLKNYWRGRPKSKEWKKKASLAKLSEKNPNWKGDNAGIVAIHKWVLRNKPKPKFCEYCKKRPPVDLANISQKYKRDINDFEWLCRKCHMKKDGRLKKLHSRPYPQKPPIICSLCKKIKKHKGKGLCETCYNRQRIRGVIKICIECGKKFLGDPRPHHKRCSMDCRKKAFHK